MPRSTMRAPQPDIIEHFGNADAVPQLPERCLSRKAGIVRCCLKLKSRNTQLSDKLQQAGGRENPRYLPAARRIANIGSQQLQARVVTPYYGLSIDDIIHGTTVFR